GAALGVVQVRRKRFAEGGPAAGGVRAGQDGGVDYPAQRGAVRGPGEVVVHVLVDKVGLGGVAESVQCLGEPVGAEQVDQHEDVGLLGQLVPVGAVALGLKDQVQPANVAVSTAIVFPVQLGKGF